MSNAADLIRAIAGLSWVVLAIAALVALRSLVKSQETPLTKLGIGPAGVTMEFAEKKLAEAASKEAGDAPLVGQAARRSVIERLRTHAALLKEARILWVDDHPENNTPLVELLRKFGASVDTPRSNDEALRLMGGSRYDVIISDVARDNEGAGSALKGVELARTVFDHWGQQTVLFTARFDPARLPGASSEQRLELVSHVQRSVFARTNRADEALHYILDLLER